MKDIWAQDYVQIYFSFFVDIFNALDISFLSKRLCSFNCNINKFDYVLPMYVYVWCIVMTGTSLENYCVQHIRYTYVRIFWLRPYRRDKHRWFRPIMYVIISNNIMYHSSGQFLSGWLMHWLYTGHLCRRKFK